jgi:hypothetical protein
MPAIGDRNSRPTRERKFKAEKPSAFRPVATTGAMHLALVFTARGLR